MNRNIRRLIALFALAALLSACSREPRPGAPSWSRWEAWEYQRVSAAPASAHDISFTVAGEAQGRTRVAFCIQDEGDHYFLELAPSGSVLGIVELGVERPLQTIAGLDLARLRGRTITIERRPLYLTVLLDGAAVGSVTDTSYEAGGVAFGGIESGLRLQGVRVTQVGQVHFSDKFMRTQEDAHAWRLVKGDWAIRTLKNPARSVNAFSFTGQGQPALAVTGRPHWSCVEFRSAMRARQGTTLGAVVAYRDPANYFLFRWMPRGAPDARRQLVWVNDGVEEVIAEAPGGYIEDQWYEVSFWYGAGRGLVRVDDLTMFEAQHPRLTSGSVGFLVETAPSANDGDPPVEFDHVLVRSESAFVDRFAADGAWTPHGGRWRYLANSAPWEANAGGRAMIAQAHEETALNVVGDPEWSDYSFAADVGPWSGGVAGIAVAVNPGANYYSAEWGPSSIDLCKTVNGRRTTLASSPLPKTSSAARMELSVARGTLRLLVDGREALSARDTEFRGGRAALLARNTEIARFGNVAVQPLPPLRPLIAFHDTFSHETSDMARWSTPVNDWDIARRSSRDKASAVLSNAVGWHRADVPGDAKVEMKMHAPLDPGHEATLMLSGQGGGQRTGYSVTVARPAEAADGDRGRHRVALWRKDQEVAAAFFNWPAGPETLALDRKGRVLSALAGDREILRWMDADPLVGVRVGMAVAGPEVSVADFNIHTPNVVNYIFQNAPLDWRKGSGNWDVSSRWECDPRWSFFSGSGSGDVAIWNKRDFEGDMTLEFFAGFMMDRSRGGRYEYASDLNVTICADGNDLNTGYSFVFGGRNNTVTRLYREDVVLAETRRVRIEGQQHHRHWYYIRITKRGGKLEMTVDGRPALSVEDPDPLDGARVALWTRNNGIVIGRVRISADRIGDRESPDVEPPAQPKSIY